MPNEKKYKRFSIECSVTSKAVDKSSIINAARNPSSKDTATSLSTLRIAASAEIPLP